MRREFFMEGETLMVSMQADAFNVVTRPATAEEKRDHEVKSRPVETPAVKSKAKK